MIRTILNRLSAPISPPISAAVFGVVAALAMGCIVVLQTAVEGARTEFEKLDGLVTDERAELEYLKRLVGQGYIAGTDGEKQAFLEAVDEYPAREVDPLERAEAQA